jgi:hypothetical protein
MCTTIVEKTPIAGSARGAAGWFALAEALVSYDHPFHAQLEHAVNIDFVNQQVGLDARVGVELTIESARELAKALLAAVEQAEAYEGITASA